ncbi:MAG: multiheme c-type cytochrome [Planctomycetota bacterium]|jgi:hypothetical protein
MRPLVVPLALLLPAAGLLLAVAIRGEEETPYAPSKLSTASGKRADPDSYYEASDCGECHVDQYNRWRGSMHSRAHHDPIYLAFAKLARKEGGDALYKFCSGCHAPLAVATGEIPDGEPTFLTDEGVTCDVCHNVKRIRPVQGAGGANASIVLEEGEERYGPLADAADNPNHESAHSELHTRSEFCSACHTLLHPTNGLVIENTYEEWKKSPYAKAGIQCQDCHMRTVAQAIEVARTMTPLKVAGKTTVDSAERPDVHAHLFVGGNANDKLVGASDVHIAEAEARLQSAATLALKLPESAAPGATVEIEVAVTNVGAGHAIPTSITELRQVWIDLAVRDAGGKEIFRSGAVDAATGKVDRDAVMYHAVLLDEEGEATYKPWRAVEMLEEKLIPPKETVRERYAVRISKAVRGPFAVEAILRYRSAPQEVMDQLFGRGRFLLRIVDMATAEGRIK